MTAVVVTLPSWVVGLALLCVALVLWLVVTLPLFLRVMDCLESRIDRHYEAKMSEDEP